MGRYHFTMQNRSQSSVQTRTGGKSGIWLALAVALGLHAIFLLLPISRQNIDSRETYSQLELQLITPAPPALAPPVPMQEPETVPPPADPIPETKDSIAIKPPEPVPPETMATHRSRETEAEPELAPQTSTILARQFITEKSVADQLFGMPLEQKGSETQKDFHYPARPNMLSMLDRPMQELPFEYTPGLVRFSYDPGVKGDLQRFWDVITPEFGWRTRNGTEFKCIWILIIGGCGWK